MNASLQERVVGEVDAGHDVRGAERHLLGFCEEVVRIAIEHQPAHRHDRHQFLWDDLGRIQHVEGELFGLLLGEDLKPELVFREGARLDRFPQVAAVEVGIGSRDLHRLVPHERVRPAARTPVELHEVRIALLVDEPERVHTKALHRPVASRNGPVGHRPHEHVRDLRHQRREVPERVVSRRRLRHREVRFRFRRVHQVGKLHRILNEEDGDVVADEIPVAFLRVELGRKAADVARGIG